MRSFILYRKQDVTGASGEGFVAEGVQFFSGKIVIHWRTGKDSIVIWEKLQDALAIHGHDGKTVVLWDDEDWINPDGHPMHLYCEGLSNLVTGALEGHVDAITPPKGWSRPCLWVARNIDPKLAEERHRAWRDEVVRVAGACIGEQLDEKRATAKEKK